MHEEHSTYINSKHDISKYFDLWYPGLVVFAQQFLPDQADAEDVVQNAFIKLFENFEKGKHINVVKGYLYKTIRNKCINLIKHEKVKQRHAQQAEKESFSEEFFLEKVLEEETMTALVNAINTLPNQCKEILMLSLNGLKNNEIAEDLNISINTVKSQKLRSYRRLREQLKDIYQIIAVLTSV
ncbi:MAG: RNA polymerase sigma-70 factor [Bacteroidales bacterium]|nr:RNA polymerase sigma-70 factor [Bacteroidales bacterium]